MNILVYLPGILGDVVASSAFVQLLHREYPDARIDVITNAQNASILKFLPFVFHSFRYSDKEYKGKAGVVRFGKKISAYQIYDIAFNLDISFNSYIMLFFTGAKVRVGFKNFFGKPFLTHAVKRPVKYKQSELYKYLFEKFTGRSISEIEPVLKIPDVFAKPTIKAPIYVMLYLGDNKQQETIPERWLYELSNYILHKYPAFSLIVSGSGIKKQNCMGLMEKMIAPERVYLLDSEKNLTELVRTIYYSSVLICPLCDITVIAKALNIRTIVFPDNKVIRNTGNHIRNNNDINEIVSALHVYFN